MRQIIAIGGEPASGKTTLMRGIIARLGGINSFSEFNYGTVKGIWHNKEKLLILGVYDDQTFAGTDRLSMAVITDAVKFLEMMRTKIDYHNVAMIFEGDRLFNKRFLNECKDSAPTAIVVLNASEENKTKRHVLRGDKQKENWLKGRKTKVENLINDFPEVVRYNNDNEIDQSKIIFSIFSLISRKGLNS